MKRVLTSLLLIVSLCITLSAQNKKAEKDSLALVRFEKALAAINDKDFVIIAETYGSEYLPISDNSVFLSYEKEYIYLQGQVVAGNEHTNRLTISDYEQTTDKKGNVKSSMQVRGNLINGKIEISLRKGGGKADVIITPTRGDSRKFTGEVVPRIESKYFKRTGGI
jgi:thioredoxin-related protein